MQPFEAHELAPMPSCSASARPAAMISASRAALPGGLRFVAFEKAKKVGVEYDHSCGGSVRGRLSGALPANVVQSCRGRSSSFDDDPR
jgi:hypothetical protein